ncbi:MAG TPA: hypothetical protein VGL58_20270 [Caulobacteraceae bacterium]|jgi:hypothetical protein
MDAILTGAGIALAIALAALFGWLGARPVNPLKGPRLVPYRMLMLVCAAPVLILGTHLVSVLQGPGH